MYKNSRGRPGAVLAAAAVAQFVFALDMSVVNVALPAIRTALGFAPLNLSWIVHGYALTFGGLLLLGGRACDLYGHRRLFVLGLAVFGLCSLGGGLAQEPWQLIAARAGQGLGAAAAAPAALGMLTTTFPEGPRRVRALGVWSAVNAAGGALGVLAGGLLTEYAGWRWVMLVNLPIVAAALALVPAGVPAGAQPDRRERPDVLGAVLATGGVGLLVFGVVSTDVRGWGSPATVATLAAAAALLAAFAFVESKATAPLLRLGLLRSRWVAGANVLVFLAAAGQFAAFYFVSLYMQQVLGMGAAATGAAFLPFSVCLLAGIIIATRVTAARTPEPPSCPARCWLPRAWPGSPSSAPAAASSPTCSAPASSPASASDWSLPRSPPPRPPASPPARPAWPPAFSTAPANSVAASAWPSWPPSPHSAPARPPIPPRSTTATP